MTKKSLASRFLVSEVTIGKVYGKIKAYKEILCDDIAVSRLLDDIKKTNDDTKIPNNIIARMKKFGLKLVGDVIMSDEKDESTDDIISEMSKCSIHEYKKFKALDFKFNTKIVKSITL